MRHDIAYADLFIRKIKRSEGNTKKHSLLQISR